MSISRLSRACIFCVPLLTAIVFMACEQKPLIVSFDDSEWQLLERSYTIQSDSDTAFVAPPIHALSWSLYAGYTADTLGVLNRESAILMRFTIADTAKFARRSGAKIRLFHRAWDEDPVIQTFDLYGIVFDTVSTQWNENKIGWTLDDSLTNITNYISSAEIQASSVQVYGEGDSLSEETVEFLEFSIDSLSTEGYIIEMASISHQATFYSRHDIRKPYLMVDYPPDTTDTDTVDATQEYYYPTADLSLYPSTEEYRPTLPTGLVSLNHSEGLRYHISVSDLPFIRDEEPISIVTGRLILYVDQAATGQTRADMSLVVYERPGYFSVSDSIVALILLNNVYTKGADSLIIPLGAGLLNKYVNDPIDGGLDFVVVPQNHDFDHLYFWGAKAPDSLRPRLEIIVNNPYGEEQ